jgi:hypothetical protein
MWRIKLLAQLVDKSCSAGFGKRHQGAIRRQGIRTKTEGAGTAFPGSLRYLELSAPVRENLPVIKSCTNRSIPPAKPMNSKSILYCVVLTLILSTIPTPQLKAQTRHRDSRLRQPGEQYCPHSSFDVWNQSGVVQKCQYRCPIDASRHYSGT